MKIGIPKGLDNHLAGIVYYDSTSEEYGQKDSLAIVTLHYATIALVSNDLLYGATLHIYNMQTCCFRLHKRKRRNSWAMAGVKQSVDKCLLAQPKIREFVNESFNYVCKINSISLKNCHLQKNCRILTCPNFTIGKHYLAWLFFWGKETLTLSTRIYICSNNPENQEWTDQ